jgi:hypothetical protein
MKHLRPTLWITGLIMMMPAIAYANAGPAIAFTFGYHLIFLTWVIGLGEGFFLFILFRAWRLRSGVPRIFISMILANIASAWVGMLFVNSVYAARIMGDVTIESLMPAFWKMVYATFALTLLIEFPFFLWALYGRRWLFSKAVAATLLAHGISYALLFSYYSPNYLEETLTSYKTSFFHQAFSCAPPELEKIPALEVVAASAFEMKEDYDLYYISPDGKQVLRSDLMGNDREVITTFNTGIMPDRLYACPRKVIEESPEGTDKKDHETIQRVCWESGFDLYVLTGYDNGGRNRKSGYKYKDLLVENFSPRAAVKVRDGEYYGGWDTEYDRERTFRSFGDAEKWEFYTDYWPRLDLRRVKPKPESITTATGHTGYAQDFTANRDPMYLTQTPIINWPIRNGTQIAGDYGVFQLGKDQICILDPEKKRIALIARGFGPVVAKPPLASGEELPATSGETSQNSVL